MTPTRVIGAAACLLLLSAASFTESDPDLWGHVRFGLDILESRQLPSIDPYSFTQDRAWINHEWLSELFMGAAWRWGGTPGLTLLKALLALTALVTVWRVHRHADVGWRIAALAGAAIVSAQIARTQRPQLWSLAAMALLAAWLPSQGPRRPWILFVLFCVWANAHGGWIVGLGVVSVWALAEVVSDRASLRGWAIAVGASTAGTLATPYGWQLWEFMFETVRLSRPQIEDWRPLWEVGAAKGLLWALVAGWAAWFLKRLPVHRLATGLVLIVLAAGGVKVIRIVPLFGIATMVLLGSAVASWRPRRSLTPLQPHEERIAAAVIAAACVVAAVWIGRSTFTCIGRADNRMPDPAIVRALAGAPPGRMVTFFNWGEYALWHLGPRIRVSMDGRRETVYSDRRLQAHDDILFGRPEGLKLVEEWRPEFVWLPASSVTTRQWLAVNGYRVEISDAQAFVAVRADVPALAYERTARASPCFPE